MKKILLLSFLVFSVFFFSCGSDPDIGTEKYIIVVEVEGLGKVIGTGSFNYQDLCTLKAIPDTVRGYKFNHWLQYPELLYVNSDSIYTFTVDEPRRLKAVFVPK